jgi:hypothetical protein
MPRYVDKVTAGVSVNRLYSYGADSDELFSYDCEERVWDTIPGVHFDYPATMSDIGYR